MTISIERLLRITAVRTPGFEPRYGCLSPFNKDDALGVLAQVQKKHPIGLMVLESEIAGCEAAGRTLINGVKLKMIAHGLNQASADALALLVWREVCGSLRCQSCNGVGERYSKRYRTLNECQACCGTGKTILTPKNLAKDFSVLVGEKVTSKAFNKRYYKLYINAVDQLHKCESDAAMYAASILRMIALQDVVTTR
ncbi:hypothetical protein [Shewanella atlantica]|uniref:Antitermination protein n=1 Tax=Shewanella atlantica TaxID=271099 RepID=A0A3S0LGA6_9GAMM|nr:hypothetical protein [Shewanella atlantica]RTR34747.1 hypothetical protein EKG39_03560 [Shewanella atlantica]